MKKIFYYLIFIIIAGGGLVSFWIYQKYFQEEKQKFLEFKIEKGSISETVRVRGEVVSQKEFNLEFPFSGTVEEIFVKEGQKVDKGERLIKLETIDFELELKRLEAGLAQSGANLDKLIVGATKEEIQVIETKTANAQKSFDDAKTNLDNVKNKAEADLQSTYNGALAALQKSVSVGKTALLTLTDIQYDYFNGNDSDSNRLSEAKRGAVYVLLGAKDAGRWKTEDISKLTGGAFGLVQNTVLNQTYENIDAALVETSDGLQKVKDAFDMVPISDDLTATDKTNLSTEKTNVNAEIITVSGKEQTIAVQKVVNQNNIDSAQISLNDAKSALDLAQSNLTQVKARARTEDIEIAKAKIQEIESQIGIIKEKIKKSTLYAPVAAQILKIELETKEVFKPGQIVISLSAFGYKIQADVSELDIGKIREFNGNEVLIKLDAFQGEDFQGKIISIEPKEIIKEGDKFYKTNIYFDAKDKQIRSGMSTDLFINIARKDNVLKLPDLAVYKKNEKNFVTVVENGQQKEVEIEIGISDEESVEVTNGLREGQIVTVPVE